MPYVRKRGSHLAIVHGARHPETKKVEQQVLITLHSKAEALAALGRTSSTPGLSFRQQLEGHYPEIRFSWPKLEAAIEELKDELPDIAKSREERATGGFDEALRTFAKHAIEADPQRLDSAREVIESNRAVLDWLMDLVEWRLDASEKTEPHEFSRDPFGWRLALEGGTMDPELEEEVAIRIDDGREDEAEQIFLFLARLYPRYAEAWNYLGLISLERDELEEALDRFETCEKVGRRLFPKRIAKSDYWTRLETRPYMRGLQNQCLTLHRMGRHAGALRIAERLESECGDDITSALHRSAIYLDTSEWLLAHDAAVHIAGLYPEQSLVAAFAAFELNEVDEARARFVHAALNQPRAVALVLDRRSAEDPRSMTERMDHDTGVGLRRTISRYLAARSTKSKEFFTQLCQHDELVEVQQDVVTLERQLDELRGAGGNAEYQQLHDRLRKRRTWEFAQTFTADVLA